MDLVYPGQNRDVREILRNLIGCLEDWKLEKIDFSREIKSISFQLTLGVYVPVGGKQLLTFMDDLNMPSKDTFGSQPPLELIRQWIDYGFWFDRQKQSQKFIKVISNIIKYNNHRCSLHT